MSRGCISLLSPCTRRRHGHVYDVVKIARRGKYSQEWSIAFQISYTRKIALMYPFCDRRYRSSLLGRGSICRHAYTRVRVFVHVYCCTIRILPAVPPVQMTVHFVSGNAYCGRYYTMLLAYLTFRLLAEILARERANQNGITRTRSLLAKNR